jgi:hypothetical protein
MFDIKSLVGAAILVPCLSITVANAESSPFIGTATAELVRVVLCTDTSFPGICGTTAKIVIVGSKGTADLTWHSLVPNAANDGAHFVGDGSVTMNTGDHVQFLVTFKGLTGIARFGNDLKRVVDITLHNGSAKIQLLTPEGSPLATGDGQYHSG